MNIRGWSIEDVYETVRGFGFRGRCLTLLFAMVHFLFVLAFPILCCLKVDHLLSTSWALVFLPLWVLDAIYYGSLLFSLLFSDGKLYAFCKEILLLIVQVFIVMKLDGGLDWTLVAVLTPYFTCEVLNFLEVVIGGVLGQQMLVSDSIGAGVSQTEDIEAERLLLVKAVARKSVLTLLRLTQALLIGMKVDGNLEVMNWWRVFTPVWFLVVYLFWYPIKKYINSTSSHRLLDAVFTAGVVFMLVAPFFLLVDRLEGKEMSSFDILMPWMLLIGVSFLCDFFGRLRPPCSKWRPTYTSSCSESYLPPRLRCRRHGLNFAKSDTILCKNLTFKADFIHLLRFIGSYF